MAKKRNTGNRPRARLRGGEASGQNATVGIGGTDVSKAQSPPSEATAESATVAETLGKSPTIAQTAGEGTTTRETVGESATVSETVGESATSARSGTTLSEHGLPSGQTVWEDTSVTAT
ncbi:MAG: hypothetical protein RMJ19_07350, partial [Gemmatales bacterium]|nr:hypothetical protein [Gemmatales bacterium]MDW8175471.1 hypothetical protein [Gemmatales bacterium]